MKKAIPIIFAAAAAACIAAVKLIPAPELEEGHTYPTVYPPGATFPMPVKLDDLQSVRGLRSLDKIEIRAKGQSKTGADLTAEKLKFDASGHQDDWGTIRVKDTESRTRAMEYAYLKVELPKEPEWSGAQISMTANFVLTYPVESGNGYTNKTEQATRSYALKMSTFEEEKAAQKLKADYDAYNEKWTTAYQAWRTTRNYAIIGAGVFLLGFVLSLILSRRRPA